MNRSVFSQRTHRSISAILLAALMLLPALGAATDKREAADNKASVNIKNFGQVNDHIYRGEQPEGDDFKQLASIGIKTIVDLREDHEPGAEAAAERAGLRYINLPMAPKRYPEADASKRFLEIVNDQANWPVYVHCAGGRHRTGAMLAVYRMEVDGWDVERAYQEMKDYDFYTRFGHGCYKDYVYDYNRALKARVPQGPSVNVKAVAGMGQQR